MKKKILSFLAAWVIAITPMTASAKAVNIVEVPLKYSEALVQDLERDKGTLDVIVYIVDDLNPYEVAGEAMIGDTPEEQEENSREVLVEELKAVSQDTQKEILEFLEEKKEAGAVDSYESFYIVNAIKVKGDAQTIRELSRFQAIEHIDLNSTVVLQTEGIVDESPEGGESTAVPDRVVSSNYGWEMTNTGVVDVWNEMGTYGKGVVIGFIDSGVDWTHPGLRSHWRGYDAVNNKIDARGNWKDLIGSAEHPVDNVNHGTTMVGAALGREDDGTNATGVAPEAQWIAVRAFDAHTATNENIIKAGEWMLAPNGDPALAPDIINNSWGGMASSEPWFNEIVDAWLAAGILPVFAAGNDAKAALDGSIENPASLPSTLAVGAVNRDNKIGSFSKRGPSPFDKTGTLIKPEIVAPGINIRTAIPGGYDYNWMGTSLSAAHVSGVAALILSENPFLTPESVKELLIDTATPLSDSVYVNRPNMAYGYGLVNAYKAAKAARDMNKMERISGYSRYDTAVAISKRFFAENVNTVYIANGTQFADGLAMGPLTAFNYGPLLLSGKDQISETTLREIERLSPSRIVIVGGENAVSARVFNQIESRTGMTPLRVYGYSRFDTAVEIAKEVILQSGKREVFIVNGYREADAISIASTSTRDSVPIMMTYADHLHPNTKQALREMGIEKVTVIGGPLVVKDTVLREIEKMGLPVERVSGQTRYDTSLVINQKYFPDADQAILANGINVADALTAGPVAGHLKSPVVIMARDTIPPTVLNYLKGIGPDNVYIFGGEKAISNKAISYIMMH